MRDQVKELYMLILFHPNAALVVWATVRVVYLKLRIKAAHSLFKNIGQVNHGKQY